SLAPEDDTPALATAAPSPNEKRDALGNFCFYLHFAIMIYIVAGWAIPVHATLYFYLAFLPAVAAHWQINKNSCILNNTESWLRYGTWRSEQNAEEGVWLKTLIKNVTGLELAAWHVDLITYGIMALLWAAGFSHLRWW
ncbi:MAG TPA: hypothetical protein VFV07_01810, partial [Rhizomicrobium sp.]|nr:hypothetical protein [Rhizomicrobium sp.]